MPNKKVSISVFFPCYNDSQTIGELVLNAQKTLNLLTSDWEIIVVNDGSKDNSAKILQDLKKKIKNLQIIIHEKNKGYGGALKSGFANSTKELIFYTDGDGQYDVKELSVLLPLLSDDVDFVNGIKMTRGDTADRVFFGNLHKFITRWMFWLPIIDTDCDYRLIRSKVLKKTRLTSNSGSICVELVKKCQRAGANFREVSVHHYPRKYGKSEFFKLDKIAKTYLDLLGLWIQLMIFDRSAK